MKKRERKSNSNTFVFLHIFFFLRFCEELIIRIFIENEDPQDEEKQSTKTKIPIFFSTF